MPEQGSREWWERLMREPRQGSAGRTFMDEALHLYTVEPPYRMGIDPGAYMEVTSEYERLIQTQQAAEQNLRIAAMDNVRTYGTENARVVLHPLFRDAATFPDIGSLERMAIQQAAAEREDIRAHEKRQVLASMPGVELLLEKIVVPQEYIRIFARGKGVTCGMLLLLPSGALRRIMYPAGDAVTAVFTSVKIGQPFSTFKTLAIVEGR